MQLPACHPTQQLTSSHRRHANCPHIPAQITQRVQRQLVIAAGEARSANRTKWTQKDQQSAQQGPSSRKQEQYVASISQLTQADGAHDLVGVRLPAVTSSSSSSTTWWIHQWTPTQPLGSSTDQIDNCQSLYESSTWIVLFSSTQLAAASGEQPITPPAAPPPAAPALVHAVRFPWEQQPRCGPVPPTCSRCLAP